MRRGDAGRARAWACEVERDLVGGRSGHAESGRLALPVQAFANSDQLVCGHEPAESCVDGRHGALEVVAAEERPGCRPGDTRSDSHGD